MTTVPMIRRCATSRSGWSEADLDVAFQLFRNGMVWDGNLASKQSRDHLVAGGWAVRAGGYQAMTGRGVVAFLTSRAVWRRALRAWRLLRRNPFVTTPERIEAGLR